MKFIIPMIVAVATLSGCGYVDSGVWEDDPKNWIRAFSEPQPETIEVIRSRYMTTPHWSHEFEYFFHVKGSASAKELFITKRRLTPHTQDHHSGVDSFFEQKPSWFIPGDLDDYAIWIRPDEPRGSFRVFVNRESGDLFITDNQI